MRNQKKNPKKKEVGDGDAETPIHAAICLKKDLHVKTVFLMWQVENIMIVSMSRRRWGMANKTPVTAGTPIRKVMPCP